ncbi:MAG: hypothetical protein KME60_04755 [Cyanomargarita calcarea GSE-NOS-MK-12-04C]|uniref:Uncharacterized protein n=1 Tax=Cyanomargarita calcarea GSE-NOS-MK-12-04C TaxID=2839659 RepID=A0A951QJD7_9CYAN|nr:hypothetical protein [Cyanomargarita calcarea GSE-NOS-MK-12-04C]
MLAISVLKVISTAPPPGISKLPKSAIVAPADGLLLLLRVAPPVKLTVGAVEASNVKPLGKGSEIVILVAVARSAALETLIV